MTSLEPTLYWGHTEEENDRGTLIEELARATKRGFDDVIERVAIKEQLQLVIDNVDFLRADVHDIKLTLGPLVRHAAAMERDMPELKKRVERVERKVGLAR